MEPKKECSKFKFLEAWSELRDEHLWAIFGILVLMSSVFGWTLSNVSDDYFGYLQESNRIDCVVKVKDPHVCGLRPPVFEVKN